MAKYEKDQVLKGKVTGIQPFGAFVALDGNLTRLRERRERVRSSRSRS